MHNTVYNHVNLHSCYSSLHWWCSVAHTAPL